MATISCIGADEKSPSPRVSVLDLDDLKHVSKDTPSTCASSYGDTSPTIPMVTDSIDFTQLCTKPDAAPVRNGPPYLQRPAPPKEKQVRLVPKAFKPKPVRRKLPIGVLPGEFHRDDSAFGAFDTSIARPSSSSSWRIHQVDDPDLFQNPGTRYSTRMGKGTRAR
jgi:hypothetical protein